jgi:hypothetical protein
MENRSLRLQSNADTAKTQDTRRHQLHLWIGKEEYAFLQRLAQTDDEPVATVVRRIIRNLRTSWEKNRPRNSLGGM